jgi:hypothetical protein
LRQSIEILQRAKLNWADFLEWAVEKADEQFRGWIAAGRRKTEGS